MEAEALSNLWWKEIPKELAIDEEENDNKDDRLNKEENKGDDNGNKEP